WIFKKAFEQHLPPEVLKRPKQGFEIPMDEWLRGPLKPLFHACVLDSSAKVRATIDQQEAGKLYDRHCARMSRHGQVLWSLLTLAVWMKKSLGVPVPPIAAANNRAMPFSLKAPTSAAR